MSELKPLTEKDWGELHKKMANEDTAPALRIDYTNHRGERRIRSIHPHCVVWEETEWHDGSQWFLSAFDFDKQDFRRFAIKDIHEWDVAE